MRRVRDGVEKGGGKNTGRVLSEGGRGGERGGRLDDLLRLIRLLTHAAVVDLRKKLLLLLQGLVVFCLV